MVIVQEYFNSAPWTFSFLLLSLSHFRFKVHTSGCSKWTHFIYTIIWNIYNTGMFTPHSCHLIIWIITCRIPAKCETHQFVLNDSPFNLKVISFRQILLLYWTEEFSVLNILNPIPILQNRHNNLDMNVNNRIFYSQQSVKRRI